jgi:uncharacterized cupin superfamily protein
MSIEKQNAKPPEASASQPLWRATQSHSRFWLSMTVGLERFGLRYSGGFLLWLSVDWYW